MVREKITFCNEEVYIMKDLGQTLVFIGQTIRRNLEKTLQTWMEWTVYGKVTDESDETVRGAGSSQYITLVSGPCVTRVYTGQRRDH